MIWLIVTGIICFALGYVAAVAIVSRDPDLIKLGKDDLIVKRPAEGLVLAAVPPTVLRKLITQRDDAEVAEARTMYRES